MKFMDYISSFFAQKPKEATDIRPPCKVKCHTTKPELIEFFKDPELERLLPDCSVLLIRNSRSGFHVDPTEWIKGRQTWEDLSGKDRTSIEIQLGKEVVAAIGWVTYGHSTDVVYTFGTYVSRMYRGKGVGVALWKAMMRISPGKRLFKGHAASKRGLALLETLKEQFPGRIDFDKDDDIVSIRKPKRANKQKARAHRTKKTK